MTAPLTYIVRSTDRKYAKAIVAPEPMEAVKKFLGQRAATLRLNCWSANGQEWWFDSSVKVGKGPFQLGRDAVRSVSVFVYTADA